MLKVIVTGPESSGKTTLCKSLSKYLNLSFTKEFAREYLNNLNRSYTQEDLTDIANGQLKNELLTSKEKISIHDTDLITIKIWSEYKYGSCDKWVLEKIEEQKVENRFYLLCKPDIPWKADPLRENPLNRDELFEIYKKELERLGYKYFIVEGKDRVERSISKITSLSF